MADIHMTSCLVCVLVADCSIWLVCVDTTGMQRPGVTTTMYYVYRARERHGGVMDEAGSYIHNVNVHMTSK